MSILYKHIDLARTKQILFTEYPEFSIAPTDTIKNTVFIDLAHRIVLANATFVGNSDYLIHLPLSMRNVI